MSYKKTILITGAGGFVGKHLSQYLSEKNFKIFALMRKPPNLNEKVFFNSNKIEILINNLENLNIKKLPKKIDALITLAQSAHFREFPEKAEEVFDVNVNANLRLFQWAVSSKINQVIHASSGGIYGGKLGKIFNENDLLAVDSPLGFYLGSKLCSEIVFQNYMKYFKTAVILRPFFIYGPGQKKDMFIPRIIESVTNGIPIHLQGKQGLKVNPVFIYDFINMFEKSLNLRGKHIINVAGPDIITLKKLSEIIGKNLNKKPKFQYNKGIAVDYVGNIDQAMKKLDHPLTSFNEGIKKTIYDL